MSLSSRRLVSAICLAISFVFSLPVIAGTPIQVDRLEPSQGRIGDLAGWRVATDGDTLVVGTRGDQDIRRRGGAAHIFERNVGGVVCPVSGAIDPWCEIVKLLPTDGPPPHDEQRMGAAVAVQGDTIFVGAFRDYTNGFRAGAVHYYKKIAGVWTHQQKIFADDVTANDHFGNHIVLDGDKAYIGGNSNATTGSGAIYEFTFDGTQWNQADKIMPDVPVVGQNFAGDFDLHGDTMVVAAGWEDTAAGTQAGAAYIFTRSGSGWSQQARLEASDADPLARFGVGVAIYGDTALVGSPYDSDIVTQSGSAYVFTRVGSTWTEQLKIPSPGGGIDDFFGFVLRLAGNTAIIPSDLEDTPLVDAGAVYLFTGAGSNWTLQERVISPDVIAGDAFGWGLDVSGETMVVGAPTTIFNWQGRAGVAYVYDLNLGGTETGSDVEVTPQPVGSDGEPAENAPAIQLGFAEVTEAGETSVTITEGGPPPPAGFEVEGVQGQAVYLDIQSTATFVGPVEICIDYSGMNVNDPAKLAFLHYDDALGEWLDITTLNDVENTTLCGEALSFSFFAIVEVLPVEDLIQAILDAIASASYDDDDDAEDLFEEFEEVIESIDEGNTDEAAEDLDEFREEIEELQDDNDISDADADVLLSLTDLLTDSLPEPASSPADDDDD